MPWTPKDLMDIKQEFVELARKEGANRRELCRRFGISPKTGYALLARYAQEGVGAYAPRSRKPLHSPARTSPTLELAVTQLRVQHPAWGGRKIARRLAELGHADVPPPSTVTAILHRHGLITPQASAAAQHWRRFEHEQPNALWQIDFKGDFDTLQGRCYPLTLLDDHSRFNLVLQACPSVATTSVQPHLAQVFERYGLPLRVNADNGAPWGSPRQPGQTLSELSIWLIRLGIRVSHSAPYHPQTNGKIERFHRSLKAEVLAGRSFAGLAQAQLAFEHWRGIYNHERPHDALELQTPAQRYQSSPRSYCATLAPIEYPQEDTVAMVNWNGEVRFKGFKLRVSSALFKLPIAFREDPEQVGCYNVFFCHQRFMQVDLKALQATT
ncbi:IS481 family transposase ISBxe3 [Comamonadaceae bacterium OS-1]|nr:IS481 family transposase ISBxe3 [Comamonadaceae bacterium OS-1]BDT67960.1 IS481 family transposase ISBxe3 [Comamonadaceae bacterium OS-1]BDT68234.1 IS481 family transposase ISBxe3 [Comamonadaceae bacterium OS-1]BDT69413.1 IS481 family transposase ISBxe3 [Comamonadaceae bacterium OS-1]